MMEFIEIGKILISLLLLLAVAVFWIFNVSLKRELRTYIDLYDHEVDRRVNALKIDKDHLEFKDAFDILKANKRITNRNWCDDYLYIFLQPGIFLTDLQTENDHIRSSAIQNKGKVKIMPHVLMQKADNTISVWQPTIEDLLSNDWCILPE